MHAPGTLFVVNAKLGTVPLHTFSGATANNFGHDVKFAPIATGVSAGIGHYLSTDIGTNSGSIDFNVVFPGAYNRKVGTSHGGNATVRATVKLELKLVRESWAV
jgi:hypothetical protein